jgi:RNA polymerase sigma factor for flagellar operon FliA
MSSVASRNVRQAQAPRATSQTASRRAPRKTQPYNAEERERLILEYAPAIKYIAQRLAMRLPVSVQLDDLINAGVIGLIDAIEKYDPSRDNMFKTYAEFRIRGAMLDELRDLDWVPRSVRQKEHALERAYASLEQQCGRPATDEEAAAFLGLALDELHEWFYQVRGVSLLSLEAPGLCDSQGEKMNLLDVVASAQSDNPAFMVQEQDMQALLAKAIESLTHQEKVVISLYYHEELTMKEIGKVLDITESRVSQIHTKMMLRLRAKVQTLMEV